MDRNTTVLHWYHISKKSLSARRAWIEILVLISTGLIFTVALRKESVDRNCAGLVAGREHIVALRKESVDRNHGHMHQVQHFVVALRKESVDRNST